MTRLNDDRPVLLKEQAYQQLKQMLVDGTYVPGTFLSERRLAEQLGMSKTPVRAALERVEAEGYVTVSPQQGIVVRELSLREIKEHFEIRMALETHIVRRLAGLACAGPGRIFGPQPEGPTCCSSGRRHHDPCGP
jgi:DNA-binding GntR family transcriptional regulator